MWQGNTVPAAAPPRAAPGVKAGSASLESPRSALGCHGTSPALPPIQQQCLERSEAVLRDCLWSRVSAENKSPNRVLFIYLQALL